MDFTLEIGGIALSPVIVAIVELMKQYKIIKAEWAIWANAILSVAAYILVWYTGAHPESITIISTILNALIVFLTGVGVYHIAGKPAAKAIWKR